MTPAQEALVLEHDKYATGIAVGMLRKLPPQVEKDDIFQAARVGLCQAAMRWKPDSGVPFTAFARLRIAGAVQDHLRQEWLVSGHNRPRRGLKADISVQQLPEHFDRATPAPDYEALLAGAQVYARVSALKPRQRFAVIGWAHGYSYPRLGQVLGCSGPNVFFLRNKGFAKLREYFTKAA